MEIFMIAVLTVLALYKAQLCGKKRRNEEYLSLQQAGYIKGIFAIYIVFHHVSQFCTGSGLRYGFWNTGYLAVAVFFFLSGYGLLYNVTASENYLKGFLKKRVLKILVPFLVVYFIYIIVDYFEGIRYSAMDIFESFFNGAPIAANLWYVLFILLYYIVFYIIALAVGAKRTWGIIVFSFLFLVAWCVFCFRKNFGGVWSISGFGITVGMLFAACKEKIEKLFDRAYFVFVILFTVAFFAVQHVATRVYTVFGGWSLKVAMSLLFTLAVITLLYRIRIGNTILKFFGTISFELYMIHGVFLKLLRGNHIYINSDIMFLVFVMLASVLSALVLHKVFHTYRNLFRK